MSKTFEVSYSGARLGAAASLLFAATVLPAAANATDIVIGGTGAAIGTMEALGAEYSRLNRGVTVKVLPSLGSGGGIKALMAGAASIAVVSRPLTEAERAKGAREVEIARTPIVIATSPRNPVQNVTFADLAGLYSGKVASWKDGTPVRPVLRAQDDIDTLVLKTMSPQIATAVETAGKREGMNIASTDTVSAEQLESIPGAFGTTSLSILATEKRALKALSIEGVGPSVDALANGKYRYAKTIWLVTKDKPTPEVDRFVKFARSSAAAKTLKQSGNLPLGEQ